MEISQSTVQLLVVAVPLINGLISALVALGATALAHWYTAARESKKQAADAKAARNTHLREKLELLVELAEEHYSDCGQEAMRMGRQLLAWDAPERVPVNPPKEGVEPLDRASALQALYFPELEAQVANIRRATGGHINFLSEEIDVASGENGLEVWNNTRQATYAARSADARAPIYRETQELRRAARELMAQFLARPDQPANAGPARP